MDKKELEKCREKLKNRIPLLGGLFQRQAVSKLAADLSPAVIPLLVEALSAPDQKAAGAAEETLRGLSLREDREAIDALCRSVMDNPSGPAAKICIESDKKPSDSDLCTLFLLVTGQFDAYFAADNNFETLHFAYEKANDSMKTRIMEIIRSGDRRFDDFFTGCKELHQCNEKEIHVFTEYMFRHQNWPRLFSAFLELPLKYGYSLLERFRGSGWEPTDEEQKSLYQQILMDTKGQAAPDMNAKEKGAVFHRWFGDDKTFKIETVTGAELFTHLKRKNVRQLVDNLNEKAIPLLVKELASPDAQIKAMADKALRSLKDREDRELINILCRLAMNDPSSPEAKLCLSETKRPSDHEEACLFFVITGQLDAYFKEDDQFHGLRLAYEAADDKIKAHVMEIIRSGDRRFEGFFTGHKELRRCTEKEIQVFIEYNLRHRNWPRLFNAFLELPLKYGYPLLEHFRASGWKPDDAELKRLYRQALQDSSSQAVSGRSSGICSVFDRWLAEGRSYKWKNDTGQELLARLKEATPREGVSIAAALAQKGKASQKITDAVKTHPHWLVRLAGYMTGLIDGFNEARQDNVFWVRELADVGSVMEFWPGQATPADMVRMAAAPPEAFTGKLGAVRKVLRLLVSRNVEVGEHEPMVIEADETAAVLERAD